MKHFFSLSVFFIFSLVWVKSIYAGQEIIVQGLFTSKAVVQIDGIRHVISVGGKSPEGVKLISVDNHSAVLEIGGKQKSYPMGSAVSLDFAEITNIEENVYVDDQGMFMSLGSINGRSVRFLVDTGAAFVAMNGAQARRLGVPYKSEGKVATASTASGFAKAYRVLLKSVKLGQIKRQNVEAMVIDGEHPGPILLGMSFLNGLRVEKVGKKLTLKSR